MKLAIRSQLDIIDATLGACTFVTRGDLYGDLRTPEASRARWIAMRLMRDEGYTLTTIGRVFGRGHDTVIHGLKRLDATDRALKQARDILAGRQALTVHAPSTCIHTAPRQLPCAGAVW